jgi:hypothetical protein
MEAKLPDCLSLGVVGRDTSWHALLTHLCQKAAHMQAKQQLTEDVTTVRGPGQPSNDVGAFRPRSSLFSIRATPAHWLVPERMGKNPAWLEPLSRVLCVVET